MIEIDGREVRVGDRITAFKWTKATYHSLVIAGWSAGHDEVVVAVNDIGIRSARGYYWHSWASGEIVVRVERSSAVAAPVPRSTIPDWPLPCPRCAKAQSAVLLFNFYDCRHGCFGGGRR